MNIQTTVIIPISIVCIFAILYQYNEPRFQPIILKTGVFLIIAYYTLINIKYGFIAFVMGVLWIHLSNMIPDLKKIKQQEVFDRYVESHIEEINRKESPAFQPIPKIIIQIWITNTADPRTISPLHQSYVEQIKAKNPEFQYVFFTNTEVEPFFQSYYPEYYDTYKRLPMFIQKVDFLRYLAIHHYGGVYFDVDVDMLKPLDDAILNHQAVFPIDEYIDKMECGRDARFSPLCKKGLPFLLGQYAFAAIPKHPFVKLLIDTIHQNIDVYVNAYRSSRGDLEAYVYRTTGPDFVTNVYADYREKSQIYILSNGKRQRFGNYARHDYYGSWK